MTHDLGTVLPDRDSTARKGDHGRVLVVGGSSRYVNTPSIVAGAALRTGIDLLHVAAPERAAARAAARDLNTIIEPLQRDTLVPGHVDRLVELTDDADVLVIGNGLGRDRPTMEAVRDLLDTVSLPTVIDADGIRAVADDTGVLQDDWLLTPHAGEFNALYGDAPPRRGEHRAQAVEDLAQELGCTLLLKGAEDVVSDGDTTERVQAGNPSMTRGGTGDTLAGIAASLLAYGNDTVTAATTAAWLNGTAGDRVLDRVGQGYRIEDLLDSIQDIVAEAQG